MKKLPVLLTAALLLSAPTMAKIEHLLPRPHVITTGNGAPFTLNRDICITYSENEKTCSLLEEFFTDNGCSITDGATATVDVEYVSSIEGAYDYELSGFENEAYTLEITANSIKITAVTETGVIRAAQTLMQLAEGYENGNAELEALTMTDWPAFKLRGFMHDVGRSFINVDVIKKHIKNLSRFKVNVFHWHFTENQAWRFEVEGYPQLTSTESMTRFAGCYYTQQQCKEVAEYAKKLGVTIIPEIDMPGHSGAFKRAMGYSMQTDEGVAVLKEVLTQVADVFPDAPYIHIGADEESITYTNFLKIMTDHIHSLGRKAVVWNPISGVSINANTGADMTQMWSTSGNKITDLPNIDCRYNYTNHFDIFADVVGIYRSNIYYVEQGNEEVAGTISAAWNDRKLPDEAPYNGDNIVAHNNIYANIIASAERSWIGGGKQYIEVGGTMLPNSGEEYDEFADWERRFLFHKENSLKGEPIPYVKQTNIRWRITDGFPNNGDMNAVFPPEEQMNNEGIQDDIYTYNGTTYYTGMATGAGIYLSHTWSSVIPAYFGKSTPLNQTAYAWTYIYSENEQTAYAQIEFQNYSRSEQDKAPEAGCWDRKGSRIWFNGEEIEAPVWGNTGVNISSKEVDQQNENFPARKPIQIELKAGWNKVFMKLPYVAASNIRLNKWMFTFVLTDENGENAIDNIIYSPNKCMDEAAELVAAKISEIKKERGSIIGTAPGYYPETSAAALDSKIAEIEATLATAMSSEEREQQIAQLNDALADFRNNYTTTGINQPKASDDTTEYFYTLSTPLRGNRYPTSKGADAEIVGETTLSAESYWKFVKRADNTFDIINYSNNTYISPASNNNTALKSVATAPASGWTIKAADEPGYVIITSGSSQFNQTNNSTLGYKVYNWGSGTNTSDTGCKYKILEVNAENLPQKPEDVVAPEAIIKIANLASATYPYQLNDSQEEKVFASENITIALDVTMGSSTSNNELFVSVADASNSGDGNNVSTSPFTGVGACSGQLRFFISATNGQWHSRGSGLNAGSSHKIVIIMQKGANSKCYIDGTAYDSGLQQNFYHLADNENAHIYIGGGKTNAGDKYVFSGEIKSAQIFDRALSSDEIAAIDYNVTIEGKTLGIISNTSLANATFTWNNSEIAAGGSTILETGSAIEEPTLALKSKANAYKFVGFFSDAAYTQPLGEETEISTLEANTTIYAKFELDVFSGTFGEKAVRLKMQRDNSYTIRCTDNKGTTKPSDLSLESELWYLVGTAEAFKLQNKTTGETYALNVAATSEATAATMTAKDNATNWKLIEKDGGYAIVPPTATGMSINAYGGKGNDLKLYNANDAGGWWLFDIIDSNTLTFAIEVEPALASTNTRVAEMSFTINGTTTSLRIKGSVEGKTYYLPVGATFTLDNTFVYRGYTFEGFFNGESSANEYTNATLTPGLSITAKYAADADCKYQYLYYSNDEVYNKPYRIPAITTAPNGDIFAISDYRPCGSDIGYGEVDIKCRISKDNGQTWSEEFFIADGVGDNNNGEVWKTGYGDAAVVADRDKNEVLIMMVCGKTVCWNGNYTTDPTSSDYNPNRVARVRATYNEEEGKWEFTAPVEVTESIYPLFVKNGTPTVLSLFIGSGRICQSRVVKKGEYYRLYCSVWTKNEGNRVIYSDDFGDTWNILGTVDDRPASGGDEPKCEELPDGTVVLSSRKSAGRYFNLYKFTDSSFTTGSWSTVVSSNDVSNGLSYGSNSTNGEIMLIDALNSNNEVKKLMLQSVPTASDRSNVAIFYKEIDENTAYTPTTFAQNWTKGLQVSYTYSAYSTMTLQKNGNIGFLFEESPNGYCIVYGNLSIEDITVGAYKAVEKETGIEDIVNTAGNVDCAIYDLMGRKITNPGKGIYVINNQKRYIK